MVEEPLEAEDGVCVTDCNQYCYPVIRNRIGEGGIRTLEPRERLTVFETAPINRSGTSPSRIYTNSLWEVKALRGFTSHHAKLALSYTRRRVRNCD